EDGIGGFHVTGVQTCALPIYALQYAGRGPNAMSNWQRASDRAMTARRHLLAGGMPATSILQVAALADSAPLNVENPRAHENRRISEERRDGKERNTLPSSYA